MDEQWTIPKDGGWSKAGWTPFAGRQVRGRVRTVVIRGQQVYVDGQFLVEPGFGRNFRLQQPPLVEAVTGQEQLPEAAKVAGQHQKQPRWITLLKR